MKTVLILAALVAVALGGTDPSTFDFKAKLVDQDLEPYTREQLNFFGVKINDVKIDPLVTYFDYYTFDATNALFYKKEELSTIPYNYKVTQPFSINIEVKSDVNTDAIIKIFNGPKYDSKGFPISLEDNYMNFVELDWFKYKLVQGKNTIVRKSEDFFYYKDEPIASLLFRLYQNNNL